MKTSTGMQRAGKGATRPAATRSRGWRRALRWALPDRIQMSSDCRSRASTNCCVRSLRPSSSHSILASVTFPEVLMTHRYIKLGLTAFVLVLAFAGLMWSTLQDGTEYFKHVDEVMTNPQVWEGKP